MYDTKIKATYLEQTPEYYLDITSGGDIFSSDALKAMTADTPVDLVIPSEIDGIKVIATYYNAFQDCVSLRSVTFPNGFTIIQSNTFVGCTSLASVTISNTVTSIESYAFFGCTSLSTVTIPEGVIRIGPTVFIDCNSLTSITIPNTVIEIGENTFMDCTSLTTININKPANSITGSPWGAKNARINWNNEFNPDIK